MLDEKTLRLLEKIAQDATGTAQVKKRIVRSKKSYTGEGTALGSVLGAGAGALAKKYKPFTTAAGALLGALGGRELGKRTYGLSKTITDEGVAKKQHKTKNITTDPGVPKLKDESLLKLLQRSKK